MSQGPMSFGFKWRTDTVPIKIIFMGRHKRAADTSSGNGSSDEMAGKASLDDPHGSSGHLRLEFRRVDPKACSRVIRRSMRLACTTQRRIAQQTVSQSALGLLRKGSHDVNGNTMMCQAREQSGSRSFFQILTSDVGHDVAEPVENVAHSIDHAERVSDLRKGDLKRHANADVEHPTKPVDLKDCQVLLNRLTKLETSAAEGQFQDANNNSKQYRDYTSNKSKRPVVKEAPERAERVHAVRCNVL